MTPGLEAEVALRIGALRVDVALQVAPGETVAVVGPNGAGKSTLLRGLCGLQGLDSGRVRLGGRVLDDPDHGVFVSPEERSIGVVFQDHLLFPHLTALDNVAFGLRSRGVPRKEAAVRARRWLERVGLGSHVATKPRALSGGEAQRVALARALAPDPVMLLLDEPLAALDATTRLSTRRDLRLHLSHHVGPRLFVTHDPVDAAALADRIVVLEHGQVVQEGTLIDVARRPVSRYVADLVGVNLLRGRAIGDHVDVQGFPLAVTGGAVGDVLVVIPPRAVTLSVERPVGTARNVWQGRVRHLERLDERVRVEIAGPVSLVAEVTARSIDELNIGEGSAVWVAVKATEVSVTAA